VLYFLEWNADLGHHLRTVRVTMTAAISVTSYGRGGFLRLPDTPGLMFRYLYFMVIMPQQRQRKKCKAMLLGAQGRR